ncbi:MAG: hypothetical protein A2W93_14680 [Bacteroidetes bacterium GWF2_43_63]|nr:MAG: hypothetical protein A2W94_01250 [Bacteroidetes bacterium GWE2_42_42]OFY52664.1 MAG: hypothetical protein A2W93_14680 [Bacteroidetes bacterium GWF2_43_63]
MIGILTKPKSEWSLIEKETPNQTKLFTEYVLLLALIPAVAAFIGYGLIGINYGWIKVSGVSWGLGMAINSYLTSIISVFVTSFVINALAPSFGVQKNSGRAFQLVVFSMIPMWVGGIFMVLPTLAIISSLIGIYSLYHLYIGLDFTMKPTTEKKVGYFVVSLLVLIVVYIIIGYILGITIGRIFEPDELRGLRELNRMFN